MDRIVSQYRALRPDRPDIAFEEIVAAQRAGDPTAGRVLTECGEYQDRPGECRQHFHPDRIIINSGAYAGCELIFRVAVDELKRRATSLDQGAGGRAGRHQRRRFVPGASPCI